MHLIKVPRSFSKEQIEKVEKDIDRQLKEHHEFLVIPIQFDYDYIDTGYGVRVQRYV